MLEYGFYNSLNGDRKYDAEDFTRIFDGIIGDGVFQSVGQAFTVTASGGLNVTVAPGKAWFDHTYTYNDSATGLSLAANNSLLDRIDAIVLDVDRDSRTNSIHVVQGPTSSSSRPTLNSHQWPLAFVTVRAGASSIAASDITNMVGTSSTPFVTGPLTVINAEPLYNQWMTQFNNAISTNQATFDNWLASLWTPSSQSQYEEIMMHLAEATAVREVTFNSTGWNRYEDYEHPGQYYYSQTVTVPGMLSTYKPILVKVLDSVDVPLLPTYNQAFNIISAGIGRMNNGSVTWFCYGAKPTSTIKVGLKGI